MPKMLKKFWLTSNNKNLFTWKKKIPQTHMSVQQILWGEVPIKSQHKNSWADILLSAAKLQERTTKCPTNPPVSYIIQWSSWFFS